VTANPHLMGFKRTECACEECTRCCKVQPGPLIPGDFERIAARIGEEEAKKKLWASPGALVLKGDVPMRIRTITPVLEGGRCVFLDDKDRCTIHDIAPFGCAFFDTHMGNLQASWRANWYLRVIHESDEYEGLRATLQPARTWHGRKL
jgi:Fe-S-cluster containining protein